MGIFHAFILSVIQGITEFLPISSSAHLVLLPIIMDWQDQGLVIDIAAHFGSLLAVVFYFRRELQMLIGGWFQSFGASNQPNEYGRLAWLIIWATAPIMIIALLFNAYALEHIRNAIIIATASIIFGLLLWVADLRRDNSRTMKELTLRDAILIGLAQSVALVPGASRSGVTITAAIWLGLSRVEAARLSFLLAIPTILAATLYAFYRALQVEVSAQWGLALGVVICSAVVAFLCIHYFIKFVNKLGMLPFVAYRVILGIILLVVYL